MVRQRTNASRDGGSEEKPDLSEGEEYEEDCCEAFGYAFCGIMAFPLAIKFIQLLGEYSDSNIDDIPG